MKDHKEHRVNSDTFMCDQCDKEFDEEWKLCIHLKKHKKYSCDQCSKTFSYINAKNKHIQITHGNLKIYCHFYNNNTTCPFDDADFCRYGVKCERDYCMFKHDYLEDVEIGESLVAKDSIWNVVDESELNDGDKKNDDDNLEMKVHPKKLMLKRK